MECHISKVKVPIGEDKFEEMYSYVYHTGDEFLDKKLRMFEDCEGSSISCNMALSYNLRDHTKSYSLHVIGDTNAIEVYTDHVLIKIRQHPRYIKFLTKEEFAVLKTLLREDNRYMILLNPDLEHFVYYGDIICSFSVGDGYILRTNYLNTKYSFSYQQQSKLPITEITIETILQFAEIIDKIIETPNPVIEKLKQVQIFLLTDEEEIPCFFPRPHRKHKLIIENTFKIIENNNLDILLTKYIQNGEKLQQLLPNGIKKA